jgi:hypothetical protein
MVNGWGDIGLIFSWEATYAGCKGLELKAGSQPTVIRAAKISKFIERERERDRIIQRFSK